MMRGRGRVYTVEINENCFKAVGRLNRIPEITRYLGNSPEVLDAVIPNIETPALFYLDAHWDTCCPLVDELGVIAEHRIQPVIVIHDFAVPERPFGFDSYNGQPYVYQWIAPGLKPFMEAIIGMV
jgi:hypothetical protein